MKVAIVTGSSKGLGRALANSLSSSAYIVYGMSRSRGDTSLFHYLRTDLSDSTQTRTHVSKIFEKILTQFPTEIVFINNAAVADAYGCLGDLDEELLEKTIAVNFLEPIRLMDLFIKTFQHDPAKKIILNISSRSAVTAAAGGSLYCASKAGMEMITRAIAVEQSTQLHPICAVSVRPGLLDTELQATARSHPLHKFPSAKRFQENFKAGLLSLPECAAKKIIQKFILNSVVSGEIYNLDEVRE